MDKDYSEKKSERCDDEKRKMMDEVERMWKFEG
jgi:hypothetical protein